MTAEIRKRIGTHPAGLMCQRYRDALVAVLDLCDAAPANGDVGVMFADEIEHAIAITLGLPGDRRHLSE